MNSASRRETGARNPGKVGGILLLAGLLGLFFAAPARAQSVCVVSGQVLNISSVPVVGTNVRFRVVSPTPPYATQDLTTKTDGSGNWSLTLVQGLNAQVDIPAIGIAKDTVIPTGASCPAAFTSLTLFNRGTLTPATILSTTGPSMGGDLTGSSPNPTVVGLRGQTLASGTCAVGQAYVKAAGQFTCQNVTAGTTVTSITGGTAITVSGTAAVPIVGVTAGSITNTQLGTGAAATNLGAAGGALTGTYPSPTLATGVAATNVGALGGDLTGTLPSPTVATVGGTAAATLATGVAAANAATAANTVSTIVKRDSGGNFAAGTITGALSGNASTATALSSTLTGDASSVANAVTVLGLLGRPLSVTPPTLNQNLAWNGSAWAPASAVGTVTSVNALGGGTGLSFSGGPITGAGTLTLQGTLGVGFGGTGATTVAGAFDALSPMTTLGDTIYGGAAGTGTRLVGNTTVTQKFLSQVGDGANSAAPIWSALVSGNIPDNAANTSGSSGSFTGALVGDVTGTQGATAVALVGGSTAANVNLATVAANAATNANTVSTIVKRDGLGNFSAGTITANLAGNVTGALTGNATTSSDGLTSASGTAPLTLNLAAKALTGSVATFGAANSGVVPASGGGTVNFMRADGSWAPPTGLASVSLQGSTPGTPDTGNSNVSGSALAGAFGIIGTAGAGYLDVLAQSANPAAPPAGTARFHAFTTNGFTRFEQDNEAATNLTLGRDNVYIAKNTSGVTITKGTPVYVSDHAGTKPVILPAKADSVTTLPAMGVVLDDIATGNFGQVMKLGLIENFDTSLFAVGDKLWVSPTVAGGLTNVRPVAPNVAQDVAVAVNSSAGNGSILVGVGAALGNTNSGTNTNFSVAGTLGVTGVTTLTGGLNTPLTVPNGGSGAATLTGVVHGNGAAAMTAGNVALGSEVTGQLPIANGGTAATTAAAAFNALSPTTAAGDIIYANGVSSNTRLAGNATATKNFLSMTSSVPAWGSILAADVPNLDASKITTGTISAGVLPALAGDVTGAPGTNTVSKIQNRTVANTGPSDLQYLGWNNGLSQWEPKTITPVGAVLQNGTAPLTASWNAGNYTIASQNSVSVFNVKAYGAKGDGKTNSPSNDATMGSGSTTLNCASCTFALADVGKLIIVQGAAAGPVSLVTTIAGYTSATQVTLTLPNSSGGAIAGKRIFYGTDDGAAIASAVAAAAASGAGGGGILQFDNGRFMLGATTLNLDGLSGVIVRGSGSRTPGGSVGTGFVCTIAAGNCIQARSSSGARFEGFSVRAENSAFAGAILKLGGNVTSSSFDTVYNATIDGGGAGACTGIDQTGAGGGLATTFTVDAVNFISCATPLNLANTNVANITNNQFVGYAGTAITNPTQSATIIGNTFEPNTSNKGQSLDCTSGVNGLVYSGNWHGDTTATPANAAWVNCYGNGLTFTGNFFGNVSATNQTSIKLSAASNGVNISGNTFQLAGAGNVGVDGGGFAHIGVFVGANQNTSTTTIQGFTTSGVVAQGYAADAEIGVGTATPDTFGYGAGASVLEIKGGATGISQAHIQQTWGGVDADGALIGNHEWDMPTNTLGDKRVAIIQGNSSGTTATNRGGKLVIYTKADGGGLAVAQTIDNTQRTTFGGGIIATVAAPTVTAGKVGFGSTHATTVGAAGGASALPATPVGYLIINVDGTNYKVPYFTN